MKYLVIVFLLVASVAWATIYTDVCTMPGDMKIGPYGLCEIELDDTGPYQCHICGEWFGNRNFTTSCLVHHPPGDCCHFEEERIENPFKPKEKDQRAIKMKEGKE